MYVCMLQVINTPSEFEKFLLGNTQLTEETVADLIGSSFTSSLVSYIHVCGDGRFHIGIDENFHS